MQVVGFGEFEANLETGELLNRGRKVPLEPKPFQLLAALLQHPGQMVSRRDLRRKLWPEGTYVDFGRSLNIAVAKLRHALSDSAGEPRYIETLPKRGYRLISPVASRVVRGEWGDAGQDEPGKESIRLAIARFTETSDATQAHPLGERIVDAVISRVAQLYPRQLAALVRAGNLQSLQQGDFSPLRDLGIDHLLRGNVRIGPSQVRITAELIRLADQSILWTDSYSYAGADGLAIENEAAGRIARSVGSELLAPAAPAAAEAPAPSRDAYLEYLKAQHCASRRTAGAFWKSIPYFERAISLDSTYAAAYNGLAKSMACLGAVFGSGSPQEFYRKANDAAGKAVRLNSKVSESHTSVASIKFFYEWDWVAAERSLCRALELDPADAFAHQIYSRYLSSMRRHDEAIEKAKRACDLEPLSGQPYFLLGEAYYFAQQHDRALEAYKSALDLDETHGPAMMGAGKVCIRQKLFDEAISYLEKGAAAHADNRNILASLAAAYGTAGKVREARRIFNQLKAASAESYVSPFYFSLIAAGLGQKEQAMAFLLQASKESSPLLVQFLLPEDPRFDLLRDDRQYRELTKRIQEHTPHYGAPLSH